MAATAELPQTRPPARRDFAAALWALFASLKPTVPLLALLALGLLAALAAPDGAGPTDVAAALEKQPEGVMGTLWRWGAYSSLELGDPLHAWWFQLALVLLGLNLLARSLDRLPRVTAVALRPPRRLDERVLQAVRRRLQVPFSGDPAREAARLATALQAQGWPARVEPGEGGAYFLFAERGRLSRFGEHLLHAGLALLVLGGLVESFWGRVGGINALQDKGSFDFVFLKTADGAAYKHPLPFTVRVDDFRRPADGSSQGGESDLSVLGPDGKPVHTQTVSPGHPLRWGGWTFSQAGYQPATDHTAARFTLIDKQSGQSKAFRVRPDDKFFLDPQVTYQVVDYRPDFTGLGPAAHVVRHGPEAQGGQSDFWVFEKAPDFDRLNREDRYGIQFQGLEEVYYTGLRASRDPGLPLLFLGGLLLLAGLALSFSSSHRRLWARITPTEVALAGASHRSHAAFDAAFAAAEQAVRGQPSA